jgi:hypothetical protein
MLLSLLLLAIVIFVGGIFVGLALENDRLSTRFEAELDEIKNGDMNIS